MIGTTVVRKGPKYWGRVRVNIPKRRYKTDANGKNGRWVAIRPYKLYYTRPCYSAKEARERVLSLASTIQVTGGDDDE